MAKELSIKIKVDGQEIDVAKKSTKELTEQISALRTKLSEVPLGSKEFKQIQGDITTLEKGFQKAKNATQPFLESMAQLPGIAGIAGQSIQGLKKGFDLLAQNPLIAVFSLLAGVVLKVAEKMKNLEGVMDPLEKISKSVSGIFDVLANTILPPVVAIIETLAEGVQGLTNWFGKLVGSGKEVGDNMSYVADTMDRLNDTNAEFELSQAKSNRQLREAREIAADSTKPIAERRKALEDADKIEREIAAAARAREVAKARAMSVELANSLDYSQKQIDAIKKYDSAQLESFVKEIQLKKGLNREKSDALFQSLKAIQESAAEEATIGKKTASQLRSLQTEEANKAKEAKKKAADETKDYEKRLFDFQMDTRLQGIKDEQEKARISLDNDKQKTLKEISELTMSTARKNQLRLAAEVDFAAKLKALTEKQNQENEDRKRAFDFKIEQLDNEQIEKELDRNKANIDAKAYQDKVAMTKDTEFKKQSKEEQTRILALIDKKADNEKKKLDEEAAKKDAELVYKRIEFERQSRLLSLQNKLQDIDNSNKAELEKILERSKIIDEQAKIDRDKEIENLKQLEDKKELTHQEYLDRKQILEDKYNTTIAANTIKTEQQIVEQRKKNLDAVQKLSDSIGQLAQAMGAESEAGRALIIVQNALNLAITGAALAQAFMGLGKDLAKGFPANLIAVASTLALIATAVSQFKALKTSLTPAAPAGGGTATAQPGYTSKEGYGDGGLINGPRHASGGVMINAEGGEAVMTRGAVTMFAPLLSALNQAGGGTSFNSGVLYGARPDNPSVSTPSIDNSPVIMKTYVVENELTTSQHRQARLKDLSTL
jgi:hypothetical protein